MADEPNQGATGEAPPEGAGAPPPDEAVPGAAGAPINQGASGAGPAGGSAYEPGAEAFGEAPLSVDSEDDTFAQRPELFVGAAFAGGFVAAQILKRLGR